VSGCIPNRKLQRDGATERQAITVTVMAGIARSCKLWHRLAGPKNSDPTRPECGNVAHLAHTRVRTERVEGPASRRSVKAATSVTRPFALNPSTSLRTGPPK
jgi:hypothetical protein